MPTDRSVFTIDTIVMAVRRASCGSTTRHCSTRSLLIRVLALVVILLLCNDDRSFLQGPVCNALSSGSPAKKQQPSAAATIAVCTGPDCRVDGSSDCMRNFQKYVASLPTEDEPGGKRKKKKPIRVTGRPCVGPCGDGPCVFVLDENEEKVIQPQASKVAISLAPPDIFGSNPKGWYQVRTSEQIDEVMQIALGTAGIQQPPSSEQQSNNMTIQSSRAVYDRPRNERKVLQRLMQVSVLAGLAQYSEEVGNPGNLQSSLVVALFGLSELIMKENIFSLISSLGKKTKSSP